MANEKTRKNDIVLELDGKSLQDFQGAEEGFISLFPTFSPLLYTI